MNARRTPTRWPRLLMLLAVVLVASSCRFDGAYDLPLPGGKAVDPDDAITVTAEFNDALNVVPRYPTSYFEGGASDSWRASKTSSRCTSTSRGALMPMRTCSPRTSRTVTTMSVPIMMLWLDRRVSTSTRDTPSVERSSARGSA